MIKKQLIRKSLLTTLMLIAIVYSAIFFFYEIKFDIGGYDIIFCHRRNYNYGYGINYKGKFELWKYAENQYKGVSEGRIFPK